MQIVAGVIAVPAVALTHLDEQAGEAVQVGGQDGAEGEVLLGLAGLLSIAFGLFIILNPGAGALSIVWMLATYAVLLGVTLVILSFRLKSLA